MSDFSDRSHHERIGEIALKKDALNPLKRHYGRSLVQLHHEYDPVLQPLIGAGTLLVARAGDPTTVVAVPEKTLDELETASGEIPQWHEPLNDSGRAGDLI